VVPVTDDNRAARSSGELLRLIAAGTATSVGTAFLRSLAHHVVEAMDADVVFIAEADDSTPEATVLASAGPDAYDLQGARHATVEVVRVSVMPFSELDAGAVQDQDPDAPSHDVWLQRRREFYAGCREHVATVLGDPDWRLREDEPMVVLRFRLVPEAA
jgi:hypothetical protein